MYVWCVVIGAAQEVGLVNALAICVANYVGYDITHLREGNVATQKYSLI